MKKTARTSRSVKTEKKSASFTRPKKAGVSRVTKSVKNYGKKSLRAILLSHTFHSGFRFAVVAMLILIPFYGVYAYIGKTVANEIVISKSQILDRVAKHMILPTGNPEAVVRVQNADILKMQNPFYNQIKAGDYIIMYKSMAIIYDLRNDSILATKNIDTQIR